MAAPTAPTAPAAKPTAALRAAPLAALLLAALLLAGLLLASLLVACAATPGARLAASSPRWEARVAEAEVEAAERAAGRDATGGLAREAHDDRAVREQALAALATARAAAWPPAVARAQLLLGRLEGDVARLREALAISAWLGDRPGEARAEAAIAGLLLEAGRRDEALAALTRADTALQADRRGDLERAADHAAFRHAQAAVLRALGRRAESCAAERRAALQLSLLGDGALPALRQDVALALGEDLLALGELQPALAQLARASDLARRGGDALAERRALAARGRALLALDRLDDALLCWQRAMELALAVTDREAARALAREAATALDAHGEPADSPRRQPFRSVLEG